MTVITGGQTGIDRAALDAAQEAGISTGGWCPRGRRAEDRVIPNRYALRETSTAYYIHRTRRNVQDSDATLILTVGNLRGGTGLTADFARRMGKPCHWVNLRSSPQPSRQTLTWLAQLQPSRLNIAGPRASEGEAVYESGHRYCEALLGRYAHSGLVE